MPLSQLTRPWMALVFALLLMPMAATAQWGGMKSVIELETTVEPAEARRGEVVTIAVKATLDSKYHIYALDPQGEGPTPTELNLDEAAAGFLEPVGEWLEPKPTVKFDRGFELNIATQYGAPVFTRKYRVLRDATPGDAVISGALTYQACTETSCLPPQDKAFKVTLKISGAEPLAAVEEPVPAPTAAVESTPAKVVPAPAPVGDESLDSVLKKKSFIGFISYSFGLGLLALLTPCVFPMIPITVSFFSNKAAKSTGQAAWFAAIYVLSIVLGFAVIGFGISLVLRAMGAGVENSGFAQAIASNPWVNLFFAALYAVLALGLLEVIHIALPQGLANKLNRQAGGRTDLFGIALKALVFVVISFTCTAPLLGILIVQALQGQWLFPFFGMMAFSAGFSAPFFFLAMAPQLMGKLPRAGSWMYAVKVVMALLVVAAAILHVSKADLYWNGKEMLLSREMLLAAWATISVVCGVYLLGMIKFGDDATESIGLGRLTFGTTFLALGLYLVAGLFGRPMNPKVDAFLPPEIGGKVMASDGGGIPAARTETGGTSISSGFSWFEDIEPAMAQAKALGKPLFVDFTGWTCTNCREMEKRMFPDARVAKLLEGYVRVKLYTDDPVKAKREERQAFQARHFETIALPTYGLMTPDGKVIASEQYTTDIDRFVRFLERGVAPGAVALAQ